MYRKPQCKPLQLVPVPVTKSVTSSRQGAEDAGADLLLRAATTTTLASQVEREVSDVTLATRL